jgi:hypothetical protein
MAGCFASMLEMKPVNVRENFHNKKLLEYELLEITDIMSDTSDIKVKVRLEKNGDSSLSISEFRLVCTTKDGDFAYLPSDDTIWGITTWRSVK